MLRKELVMAGLTLCAVGCVDADTDTDTVNTKESVAAQSASRATIRPIPGWAGGGFEYDPTDGIAGGGLDSLDPNDGIEIKPPTAPDNCGTNQKALFPGTTHFGDLTDLSEVSPRLKYITGDVIIGPGADVTTLDALRCIVTIGGSLQIEGMPGVKRFNMPRLLAAGDLEIRDMEALRGVSMPMLKRLDSLSVTEAPVLERLWMPRVEVLEKGLHLEDVALQSIGEMLGDLESAGSVALLDLPQFEAFDHAGIDLAGGGLTLSGLDALETLEGFPFEGVGSMELSQNAMLASTAGAAVLDGADVIIAENPALEDLGILSGVAALDSLELSENNALTTLADLANLEAVAADLIVADHDALVDYSGIFGVASVGGDLRITGAHALSVDQLSELEANLAEVAVGGEVVVAGVE